MKGLLIQTYRFGSLLAVAELRFEIGPIVAGHHVRSHVARIHRRDLHRDFAAPAS